MLVPGELLLLKDEDLDTALCQIVATGGARGSCSNNQDIMVVTVLVLKHNNRINKQQEKEKEILRALSQREKILHESV